MKKVINVDICRGIGLGQVKVFDRYKTTERVEVTFNMDDECLDSIMNDVYNLFNQTFVVYASNYPRIEFILKEWEHKTIKIDTMTIEVYSKDGYKVIALENLTTIVSMAEIIGKFINEKLKLIKMGEAAIQVKATKVSYFTAYNLSGTYNG